MNILYIDIESTSLDITTAKICQIGLIWNEEEKSILVNPGVQITNSYIHNITDDMVKDSPKFSDIAPKIVKLINKADCLIGHNVKSYDWPLLYIELLRCGYDIKKPQIIDTLEMVKSIEGSNKLKDVYLRYFNETFEGQHNALCDIKATRRVYEYMLDRWYK